MANGTIELAPPNEGGDDRNAEVAAVRQAEQLTMAAAGLAVREEVFTDEAISRFFDEQTAEEPEEAHPSPKETQQPTVKGGKALFVEDSENYGYNGSAILGKVMPGGIRNRTAGIEGRAFRAPWAQQYAGERALRYYVTRVATI